MSEFLNRDAILGISDTQYREVTVPEWGHAMVRLRGLSAGERDAFESTLLEGKGKNQRVNYTNMRAKLLVRSIVDADGNRIFDDSDARALGRKSAAALQRLFNVAQELNGLSDEDVEELVENFDDGPSDGSSSG